MDLRRQKDREHLLGRLSEGSMQVRTSAARQALPLIASVLTMVQSDKDSAKARYNAIRDAEGEPESAHPAINPVMQRKSNVYKRWAPIILLVEVALAAFTANLTIAGGLMLHLVAGVVATALFCGLAKIGISTMVDGERLSSSIHKLERYVQRLVIAAAIAVSAFFFSRFFPFAELIFAITSTVLSFIVAILVALCLTLGELLGASNKELKAFLELSLVESEILRLKTLAEDLSSRKVPGKSGLATVALVLLLLLPWTGEAQEPTLTMWVDVSGSIAEAEWHRVRDVLAKPLPLFEAHRIQHVTLAPFASEVSALTGAPYRWTLAPLSAPSCTTEKTVFRATQEARDAKCEAIKHKAREAWRLSAGEAVARYKEALLEIDVSQQHRQTCLYPVLDRVVTGSFSVIVTDGAHAACGPPPTTPREGGSLAVVILMPDAGGEGMATRMQQRTTTLQRLYPEIKVIPSWQLTRLDATFFTR